MPNRSDADKSNGTGAEASGRLGHPPLWTYWPHFAGPVLAAILLFCYYGLANLK